VVQVLPPQRGSPPSDSCGEVTTLRYGNKLMKYDAARGSIWLWAKAQNLNNPQVFPRCTHARKESAMSIKNYGKKAAVLASTASVTFLLSATPANAAGYVYADCFTYTTGANSDGVGISCGDVVGGDARGRGDCVAAPDVYTDWIGAWSYSESTSYCWFNERGTILEVRSY